MNRSPILLMALALALAAPASQAFAATKNTKQSKPAPAPVVLPALSDEQLAVVPDVLQGAAQCEYHQIVSISADTEHTGYFKLQFGKTTYTMAPQPTSTGAVRLEDPIGGVMWLQIPSKSMLMNAKIGQRMVDECQLPSQVEFANAPAPAPAISVAPVAAATTSTTTATTTATAATTTAPTNAPATASAAAPATAATTATATATAAATAATAAAATLTH